jgi:hypothetical protein
MRVEIRQFKSLFTFWLLKKSPDRDFDLKMLAGFSYLIPLDLPRLLVPQDDRRSPVPPFRLLLRLKLLVIKSGVVQDSMLDFLEGLPPDPELSLRVGVFGQ